MHMKKVIITLSREYGSGGLAIGQQLAEALDIPFYDKKLLSRAAEESGFSEEMLRQAESKATNSLLYSLATSLGVGAYGPDTLSLYDKLYLAQFDMIRKVADEGSCLIVGRCANYVLRAEENCYHFFLHAPLEKRMERAVKEYGQEQDSIKSTVLKHDKARANYYYHYTNQKWGDAKLYDMTLDTTHTGVEGSVKMLLHYLETVHAI